MNLASLVAKMLNYPDEGQETDLECIVRELNALRVNYNWKSAHDISLGRAIAALQNIKLKRSEKPLVILDLNEVLLDRLYVDDPKLKPECDCFVGKFAIWLRPDAQSFLNHILEDYHVAIWSSAKAYNVDQMLSVLCTPGQRQQLLFVWAQEECTSRPTSKDSKHQGRPLFLKDLRKVWGAFPEFDETNTILIDNSPEKCEENPEKCVRVAETWNHGTGTSSAMELLNLLK